VSAVDRQLTIFDVRAGRLAAHRDRPHAECDARVAGCDDEALVAHRPGASEATLSPRCYAPRDFAAWVAFQVEVFPEEVMRVYRDGVCVWDSRDGGAL
jgi:hypothetical protein